MATSEAQPIPQNHDRIFTLKEAAAYANVGTRTLERYIDNGDLRAGRLGNGPKARYRIRRSDLDAWLFGEGQE